jgi:hypothetical protein
VDDDEDKEEELGTHDIAFQANTKVRFYSSVLVTFYITIT